MLALRQHFLRWLLVCICIELVASIDGDALIGKFLLFSDAHYDPYYGTKLAFKHEHYDSPVNIPCQATDAPRFSAYGCGSSKALITSAVASAASILPNPDFILFTGDATRHGTDQLTNASATVELAISFIPELFQEYFPNTSIISLPPLDIGNNDLERDYTINVTSTQPCIISDNGTIFPNTTSDWLVHMATTFKAFFVSEQEAATFACGGYMVRHVTQDLAIIVLNTVVWSRYLRTDSTTNEDLVSDNFDPFGQHEWLNATLAQLQSLGKKAYITGHIPPIVQSFRNAVGKPLMYKQHVTRYYETISHYQETKVVAGQFFGHVHSNELRHVGVMESKNNHPPMVVAGSISPCYESTPFFSIVDYNVKDGTYFAADISTYNVDLANAAPDNSGSILAFQPMFQSLVEYLGMSNLTNGEVARLASRLTHDRDLWNKYWNHWRQGIHQGECNAHCRLEQACIVKCGTNVDLYQSCITGENPTCSLVSNVYASAVNHQSRGLFQQIILGLGVTAAVLVVGTTTYRCIKSCLRRRSGRIPLQDVDEIHAAQPNPKQEINRGQQIPSIT